MTGTDLTVPGGTAYLEFQLGAREFGRFLQRPIVLEYRVKIKNPNFTNAQGQQKNNHEYIFLNKADHDDLFINPVPGVSAFIDRATISLNGKVLTDGLNVGSLSHVYKSMNQRLSARVDRVRDESLHMPRSAADRARPETQQLKLAGGENAGSTTITTAEASDSFRAATDLVRHSAWRDGSNLIATVSLDGFPLLAPPRCNALARLGKSDNEQLFLPPSTRVSVMLHFRASPSYLIDTATLTDEMYFRKAVPDNDANHIQDAEVEIRAVRLLYESFIPQKDMLVTGASERSLGIPQDVPHLNTFLMTANAQYVETEVFMPEGSRALFLAYMYGHALWPNAGSKRPMRGGDFVFPKQITNVSVRLPDHGFLVHDQLGYLRGSKAYLNPALRGYWSELQRKGLVDESFDAFIPPNDTDKPSYNQMFFLDLRMYSLHKNSTIRVTTHFQDNENCPMNLYLVCCFVTEGLLSKRGSEWSFNRVVP